MFGFLKNKLKEAINKFSNKIETKVEEAIKKEEIKEPVKEEIKTEVIDEKKEKGFLGLFKKKEKIEEIAKEEHKIVEEIKELPQEKKEEKGFFAKITEKLTTKKIDEKEFDELFSDLDLVLLENNVALEVIDKIKEDLKVDLVNIPLKGKIDNLIRNSLRDSLNDLLKETSFDLIQEIKNKKDKPYTIVFVGLNGSGKCITGDTLIPLANGELIEIKELYQRYKDYEIKLGKDYYIINPNLEVFSLNNKMKIMIEKPISLCRLKAPKSLKELSLVNGSKIKVTKEHPLLTIKNGSLLWVKAEKLKCDDYIAVPRILPKKSTLVTYNNLLEKLEDGFLIKVKNYKELLGYLKHKHGTLLKAYKELDIKQSYCSFVGYWRYKSIMPISLYLKLREEFSFKIISLQFGGSKTIPIQELNSDLSEFVGLVIAEGHLNEKVCEVTNKDIEIIKRFGGLSNNLFKIKPKSFIDSRGLIRSRIFNWTVIRLLHSAFEVPFGNKSKILTIPKIIMQSDLEIIKSFLRSYIESEAHLSLGRRSIEIPTSSKKAALGLVHLLLTLGIETTLSKKIDKKYGISYRVYINGASKNHKLEEIGLYTIKNDKLRYNNSLHKQYEITNLIPNCGGIIKELRLRKNFYQKNISDVVGVTQNMIHHYESGIPLPRENMLQIGKLFGSERLISLSSSDISWIRIKEIKTIKHPDKWVYDLSMENHNFIANNIVSHNTTTIAKLAHLLKENKLKCILVAGDTWRKAAIEQLEEHSKNLDIKIVKHSYESDPTSVAFDGVKMAKAHNLDVVLIDTAGRQHSNKNLIEEMKKIVRVIKPDLKIFVGESISGNDLILQVQEFNKAISLDVIILSKTDVDEKGGAIISAAYVTRKPIIYLGSGQTYKDLEKFDRNKIIKNLNL